MTGPMSATPILSRVASEEHALDEEEIAGLVADACPEAGYHGKRVLLIVPDGTRTAPVGTVFKAIHDRVGGVTKALDVLVALGTHQPMTEEAICKRLDISEQERHKQYRDVRFFNHEWDNPEALKHIGTISGDEIRELTSGRFAIDVPVQVNRRLFEYDEVMIIGPVFPHEVVGFSGGNKYLFPGVSGPDILNFFHWLGAVVTNPKIIGHMWTPVRRVVDRAGSLVPVGKKCFAMVVRPDKGLDGLFFGTPEAAWQGAAELSSRRHITRKPKPFHTILSCAPEMYDEVWTAGKCMYKLEPVLADGGELIIYAPHIREVCVAHGSHIEEVGYHCRDYFLKQWERFKDYPWGVLAHSTHVYGQGTFENGVETPRARVTLATGIPEAKCRQINLGYRDPDTIDPEKFADREDEGILLVRKAGEMLYRLEDPPEWAQSDET